MYLALHLDLGLVGDVFAFGAVQVQVLSSRLWLVPIQGACVDFVDGMVEWERRTDWHENWQDTYVDIRACWSGEQRR